MTASSRRLSSKLLLLIALLALGGVLLWPAPAEAQTVGTLISNLSQGNDDSADMSGNDHAQLFHTGANTGTNTGGWVLTSVVVDSEDAEGHEFDVKVCLADDTTGFPTSTCADLDSPSDYTAGNLVFTAYLNGMLLNANDNYTVVIDQDGSNNVTLDSTTSGGEDSGGATGWSIKDKFDWRNSGTWQQSGANEALRITINGYERPGNRDATGRPRILAGAEGAGILYADTEPIADADGLPISFANTWGLFSWSYQWVRVDGGTRTNITNATSASYQPVDADVGKMLEVVVSFTDSFGGAESVTSLPYGPIGDLARTTRPPTTLVSNTGQTLLASADITQQYAQGFRLGDHGQGYEISGVAIDLAAAPSTLNVALWSGSIPGAFQSNSANKLFDFENPDSLTVGLNEFTAPTGAFAYPNVNYFVVLSGFGSTLSINETDSNNEDSGGEPGAIIYDAAAVRALTATGVWGIGANRTDVLRMAVKGSKRTGGILATNFAQPLSPSVDQEIISVGDFGGFPIQLGPADRYLIRGVAWNADDTTPAKSGFTNPYDLRAGTSDTGALQFSLANSRKASGLPVWTAPRGATVPGGGRYVFIQDVGDDYTDRARRDSTLSRHGGAASVGVDRPAAAGVRINSGTLDIVLINPLTALLGEPLYAMASNLGQADNSFVSVGTGSGATVLSQGFRSGPRAMPLMGIGIDLEGSNGDVPEGSTSVSVAVHTADADGKPGAKLFDLINPSEYAAGHSFFEAPPGTMLDAGTSYVLVWTHLDGRWHRLHQTTSNAEDSGGLPMFWVTDAFHRGADVNNLTADSGGNALQIAVYTNQDITPPKRVTSFDLANNNADARGIWGNDDTFWVANSGTGTGANDKIYAYNRSDGSRKSGQDFNSLTGANNDDPFGICSDGTTMFVVDSVDDKIYAYKMSDKTRDSGKDITLATDNDNPRGLACNATHVWVSEDDTGGNNGIFAYKHDGTEDTSVDFPDIDASVGGVRLNADPRGLWQNGETMFSIDDEDQKVYAWKMTDQTRDSGKEIALDSANDDPEGLWFDGRVLWVTDRTDDKVYAYDLPGAQPDNTVAEGTPEVRTPKREEIWSATLTVGTQGNSFGWNDGGSYSGAGLTDEDFTFRGDTYDLNEIAIPLGMLSLTFDSGHAGDIATRATRNNLTLFVGNDSFNLGAGNLHTNQLGISWSNAGLSWSTGETVTLRITADAAPTDGDELRADLSRITDTDGLDNVFYHYQWFRVDGTTVTELDGETNPTYTTTEDDLTKDVQVRVIFDDAVRNKEYPRYSPQLRVVEIPPEVTGVALTSDPNADGRSGDDGTYAIGDSVTATVTFNRAVDVTAGAQITLLFGTAEKEADCAAVTNSTTVACTYEVAAGEAAPGGVGIKEDSLALNTGTIYATGSTTNAAALAHSALALQTGHIVDGKRPTLVTSGPSAPTSSHDGADVILTFSENISFFDGTKITIKEDATTTLPTMAGSVEDNVMTLTLSTALLSTSGAITVELAADAVEDVPGNGNSQTSSSVVVMLQTTPFAPTNLTATPAPDATPQLAVDLSWTAPVSDGGSDITSYQYRFFRTDEFTITEPFGSWTTIGDSAPGGANATSFTVTELSALNAPGTTFTFEVRAINGNGNGDDSAQATAFIGRPAAAPTLNWVPGDGQVELRWVTPANNGGAILRYHYFVFNNDTNTVVIPNTTNMPNSDGDTTSFTVDDLTNGTSYQVGIQAVNSVGLGTYKTETGVVPAAPPTAPRNLRAVAGGTTIILRWTAPTSNGGVDISGYEYQQKTGAGNFGSWTDITGADHTTTEHTVTGLTYGTSYSFKVRARNPIAVAGPASNEVTVVTSLDYEIEPPTNFTFVPGHRSAVLSWDAIDDAIPVMRYEVRWRETNGGMFNAWQSVGLKTSHRVEGLTNDTAYDFEVRAATVEREGPEASVSGTPEIPVFHHTISTLRLFVANTASGNNTSRPLLTTRGSQVVDRWAQPFTTGPEGAGTILGRVGIRFGETVSNQEHVRVTLHEEGKYAEPGDVLCTLKNPERLTSHSVNNFYKPDTTSDEPCPVLEVNTTYLVVITRVGGTGNINIITTSRDAEDNNSADGWSIDNWSIFGYAGQSGWAVWRQEALKVQIHGDHGPAVVALNATVYVDQDTNVTTMTVPVYLSRRLGHTVIVDYETEDRTARAGVNYTHTSGTIIFAPGEQWKSFDVEILDDGFGGSTDFTLALSNAIGAGLLPGHRSTGRGKGYIEDLSTTFRSWPEYARESGRGYASMMSFYVSLHRAKDDETYTIDYRTEDGAATAGADYTAVSGTFTFAPGDKTWKLVNVPILDDDIDDSGEHFFLVLSNPTGGARLHYSEHTVRGTILNDDDPGVGATFPTSSHTSTSHAGADDRPKVIVEFSEPVASFTYTTPSVVVDGATVDYVAGHTETGLENAYIFTLDPNGDGDITFALKTNEDCDSAGICTKTGVKLMDVPAALTIKGPNGINKLSVADATASEEDDSSVNFVVTLVRANDEAVSVDYATADGTANAGGDYTATSGTLTFSAGDTSKTVAVPIIDDDFDDDDEKFTLNLSNATAAEISDGKATGIITNKEPYQLTARFFNAPDGHDGSSTFTFGIEFSADILTTSENMRDHAFTVENGDVTSASKISGLAYLWEITVQPSGNDDVTVTLIGNRDCDISGAVCKEEDPRQLSHSPAATVTGPAAGDDEDQEDSSAENSAPTGLPTISGTPQVEQTLTADTSEIDDADGLTSVSYEYQWLAGGTDIAGATGSSYTPSVSDVGKTIQVRVIFTDDADNTETLTSEATVAVAATAPTAPQSLTVIQGSQDRQLDVSWQAPSSNGGSAVTGYRVQWKEAADSWDTAADVSEATESGTTHIITSLTGGVEYAVRVIATNDAGDGPASTEAKGTPSGGVSEVEPENTAPTGLPTISGTPQVDQTLTADTSQIDDADGLTNVSYEYQWIAGGSDIAGATGSSYTLTYSEQGKTIQVRVTFTDDRNNDESLTSAATVAVAAKPVPLTAALTGVPANHSGAGTTFQITLTFSENIRSGFAKIRDRAFTLSGADITEARRSHPQAEDRNRVWTITVKVDAGHTGAVTLILPATTDCSSAGAVCTFDNRMLSHSLSFTVPGPGG